MEQLQWEQYNVHPLHTVQHTAQWEQWTKLLEIPALMKLSSNEGDRKTKSKIYSMLYGSKRKIMAKRYILMLCQRYFQALNSIFLGISATKNLCKPLKYCTINASWWKTQYLNPHCSKSAYVQPETKKCLKVGNSFFSFFNLPMPHSLKDHSSPTRNWTFTLGSESVESKPLDHQGIPKYWQLFTRNQHILWCLDIKYKYILSLYKTLKSKNTHFLPWCTKCCTCEIKLSSFERY